MSNIALQHATARIPSLQLYTTCLSCTSTQLLRSAIPVTACPLTATHSISFALLLPTKCPAHCHLQQLDHGSIIVAGPHQLYCRRKHNSDLAASGCRYNMFCLFQMDRVVCCSSRDSIDAVVHALTACKGFNIGVLVRDRFKLS